jgi:hypothetical protein
MKDIWHTDETIKTGPDVSAERGGEPRRNWNPRTNHPGARVYPQKASAMNSWLQARSTPWLVAEARSQEVMR